MEAPISQLTYLPLDTDEIRVLRFDEEERTSPTIKLNLRRIKRPSGGLDNPGDSPPYHALSWAWGQGQPNRLILVDNCEFYISGSLHAALCHLRSSLACSNPMFLLWIDAICINQTDEDEKSIQVLHMRETYSNAYKVIVWLGDISEQREATGRVASFLPKHIPPIPDGHTYVGPVPKYLLEPQNAVVVRTLCQDVLRRPWWWRMWVIQEVSLARSIVVICDGHHFSWEHLVYTTQWIKLLDGRILNTELGGPGDQSTYLPNISFKAAYRHKRVFGGPVDLPILELLQNSSSCLASDPKDMIYSLLGLATDIESSDAVNDQNKLVLDYKTRTVAEVYIDFATIHMRTREENPLDVITFRRFDPMQQHSLPSWVPDWRNLRETSCSSLAVPDSAGRAQFINIYRYQASAGARQALPIISRDNVLEVTGVRFDSVSQVGAPYYDGGSNEENLNLSRALEEWQRLAFGEEHQRSRDIYPASNQTLLEVFDRTITADTSLEGARMMPDQGYLGRCRTLENRAVGLFILRRNTDLEVMKELLATEIKAVNMAARAAQLRMLRRRFFSTAKGFFGLGPANTEHGDTVFVLYGCSVPVILRPKGEYWTFIGEAYVAGIMDGEVIQAAASREPGKALLKGTEQRVKIL